MRALPRLLFLAILLIAEALLLSVWLDNADLASRGGILAWLARWGAWTVRGIVGSCALFFTFAYLKNRPALEAMSAQAARRPLRRSLLAAHLVFIAAFAAMARVIYSAAALPLPPNVAAVLWLSVGIAALAFAVFALIRPALWIALLRQTGALWAYTVLAVVPACVVGIYSQALWDPIAHVTFALVKLFLTPFAANIVSDPVGMVLGTSKFSVEIAPQCSGFEGAGLILAFGVVWLCLFRQQCRFPQALLLLPAGVAAIYLLNAARITALILIGNAGAPQIALGGFHSQAGWIAFNAVALGFSVAARRVPWLTKPQAAPEQASLRNPTAAYLVPFLSILAMGIMTTAASGDFEWLYPLRFFAAGAALWVLRKGYADLDWKAGWFGIAIGVAVFALWIGLDALLKRPASDAMPAALTTASPAVRLTWLAFRILAATVTVPIAEELAFRGFLLRRFLSPDFETLPLRSFTWLGLGVSSLAFGLLHGDLWFAAILAGLLYAWAMLRRGRIGEAVLAHATTNALLAAYVLLFHKWHLW